MPASWHETHRGNLRADVFVHDTDRQLYKSLLAQTSRQFGLEIWAGRPRICTTPSRPFGHIKVQGFRLQSPGSRGHEKKLIGS
ncbi:MAG: hypothetical protein ACR2IE_20200 [Candidatus Sumerlaeaceae bacterium]